MLGDYWEENCEPPELFFVEEKTVVTYPPDRQSPFHCRVCLQIVEKFVCPDCINCRPIRSRQGVESFASQVEELGIIKQKLQDLIDASRFWIEFHLQVTQLQSRAEVTRESSSRLQLLIDQRRHHNESLRERLRLSTVEREKRTKSLARVEQLVARRIRLKSAIDSTRSQRLLQQSVRSLAQLRQKLLLATFTQIFPLQVVVRVKSGLKTGDGLAVTDAIAEAASTNYVKDRWIFHDGHCSDLQFKLVQSELPDNGDYSAFKRARFGSPDADTLTATNFKEYQKALGIPAGLGYAAQLCNVVANVVDFPLPYHLGYHAVCGSYAGGGNSFDVVVAKLNSNVAVLCLSQGYCPADMVTYGRPVFNLFNLFSNASGFGLKLTSGPFRMPGSMVASIIEQTKLLSWEDETAGELVLSSEDSTDDWETVSAPDDWTPAIPLSPPPAKSSGARLVNSLFTSATRLLKTATTGNIHGLLQ